MTRRERRCRKGTAAIELAIILPVLLLVVFGCIDFGRVAYYSIALENAVGSGSHYAATHRYTDYTIDTWKKRVTETITEEMQNGRSFDSEALRVTITTDETNGSDKRVSVAATYPFETIVDWPGLPKSITLRHRVSTWQYQ